MKKPFYFDGAFGTYYAELFHTDEPCELANLSFPERVKEIHKEYIRAGVDAIKTNTFGVNLSLTDDKTIVALLTKGYQIACESVQGTDVAVFCDIGYIDGEHSEAEYKRNVDVFLSLGGKNFLFETLQEYGALSRVISYLREREPSATVLVSFSVSQDGYTKKGYFYKNLLKQASLDADIVGLNCQCGPTHLYRLISQLNLSEYPSFSAMPNAGYPQALNGRTVYSNNISYYSEKLLAIASLGVPVLGGCCGTTPAHLEAVIGGNIPEAEAVTHLKPSQKTVQKNCLLELLARGEKVFAVEIDPPVDTDTSFLLAAAHRMKQAGAHLITVADSPLARTRADSLMLSAKIKREVEIEVLPHLSCRDKNYIAMRSSLIGANIEQVNNVLVVTGDPISRSEGGVFQFNSYTLMNLISNLNQEIFPQNPYTVCGALNVNALHFETELTRAKTKIASGAKVLLTQPIFSEQAAENFRLAKQELNCYVLAGILPIASWKNAMFLNNEVSGIEIPSDFIEQLKVLSPDEVIAASVAYSMNMIRRVYDCADGFYIMTPLKKTELVASLLAKIKALKEG
ncbi:MAG: bifunctional homocysteine S-methyltransferase/methylenetetrahydrofolate reductase [Clostridia bacterium]|nr:bifunctional homocysteine S-methyltransferase/methylenetetrahydrofolate reductase [Clostridia bacterium]